MAALGVDSIFTGLGLRASRLGDLVYWLTAAFIVKSVVPVIWLCFSLTYSRADYREFLDPLENSAGRRRSAADRFVRLGSATNCFRWCRQEQPGDVWRLQFGAIAKALNVVYLVVLVLILMNLEQTFRSAVGTMRWRLKFVVLALVVIFGARLYVRSQAILFSAPNMALWGVESGALLIGCVFLALAYARTGWAEIAVYPSSAVLAIVADGPHRRRLPLRRRRAGASRAALWRSGAVPVSGVRRSSGNGRAWPCCFFPTAPVRRFMRSSSVISERPSTIP